MILEEEVATKAKEGTLSIGALAGDEEEEEDEIYEDVKITWGRDRFRDRSGGDVGMQRWYIIAILLFVIFIYPLYSLVRPVSLPPCV